MRYTKKDREKITAIYENTKDNWGEHTMTCPMCAGHKLVSVKETGRGGNTSIERERRCVDCGKRMWTIEYVATIMREGRKIDIEDYDGEY